MLAIFEKASKVVAWLGDRLVDSDQAIECIHMHRELHAMIEAPTAIDHMTKCVQKLERVRESLITFYNRPWFRRVWIRQEVFGAKTLDFRCGVGNMTTEELVIVGSAMLRAIESFLAFRSAPFQPYEPSTPAMIDGVSSRLRLQPLPGTASRPSRDLFEVLLAAPYFKPSLGQDFVYSALGMCDIRSSRVEDTTPSAAIVVDYRQSVEQVLQDASTFFLMCSLQTDDAQRQALAKLFNYRLSQRPTMPSWIMDWQNGCSREDTHAIDLGLHHVHHCIELDPLEKLKKGQWSPSIKLIASKIQVIGRIFDMIGKVTECTLELPELMDEIRDGRSVPFDWLNQPFDPLNHHRRLAHLTIHPSWAALVPATAEENDLLVDFRQDVLPMILSCHSLDDKTRNALVEFRKRRRHPVKKIPMRFRNNASILTEIMDLCGDEHVLKGSAFGPYSGLPTRIRKDVPLHLLTETEFMNKRTREEYTKDKLLGHWNLWSEPGPLRCFIII